MAASLPETKLNSYLWRNLCNLGISRATPTRRAIEQEDVTNGHWIWFKFPSHYHRWREFDLHFLFLLLATKNYLYQSSLNIPINTVEEINIRVIAPLNCLDARSKRGNLFDVLCQRNASACKSELLRFSLANCRSVTNKTSSISDYVTQDCKPRYFRNHWNLVVKARRCS